MRAAGEPGMGEPGELEAMGQAVSRQDFLQRFAGIPARVRQGTARAWAQPPETALAVLRSQDWSTAELFIHARGGRAAVFQSPVRPDMGYLGFFEAASRDIALDLLRAGGEWLSRRGATSCYGPVDRNTWFAYRYAVSLEDEAPFAWEPVAPQAYPGYFREAGFEEAERYHSWGFRSRGEEQMEEAVAMTRPALDYLQGKGFSFRPLDKGRLMEKELPLLHGISMEGFSDNFLFEPIGREDFTALYAAAAARVNLGPSRVAFDPGGKPAGFLFCFVDRNYAVIKSTAVLPAYRGFKLSTALLHLALAEAQKQGLRQAISALVKSGSKSEFHEMRHARAGVEPWRHAYVLFRRRLP